MAAVPTTTLGWGSISLPLLRSRLFARFAKVNTTFEGKFKWDALTQRELATVTINLKVSRLATEHGLPIAEKC